MLRWLLGRGATAADVADVQARIAPALWDKVMRAYPFLRGLNAEEMDELRARAAWLLASKNMNGARGLVLTDFMQLSIAVQAALPVLKLPTTLYEGWDEIIVYPGGFLIPRRREDDIGVVHEYVEDVAGEAWDGGPVVLSWKDAQLAEGSFNVIIHEFAHKLDLMGGQADGMPDLTDRPELNARLWLRVLNESLDRFTAALETVESAIPPYVDPESPDADAWYGRLPLDPYAATDEAEFFAVSSEAFFVDPTPLAEALPEWYDLLRTYYRQDPLARRP